MHPADPPRPPLPPGTIVYILLCASPPFHGKTDAEMNAKIKRGEFSFPDKYWRHISDSAKDFISALLTVDPTRRLTAMEALQHDWTTSIGCYTSDLFTPPGSNHGSFVELAQLGTSPSALAAGAGGGAGGFRGRLGDLNRERRAAPNRELQELLGLPADEEVRAAPELAHSRQLASRSLRRECGRGQGRGGWRALAA